MSVCNIYVRILINIETESFAGWLRESGTIKSYSDSSSSGIQSRFEGRPSRTIFGNIYCLLFSCCDLSKWDKGRHGEILHNGFKSPGNSITLPKWWTLSVFFFSRPWSMSYNMAQRSGQNKNCQPDWCQTIPFPMIRALSSENRGTSRIQLQKYCFIKSIQFLGISFGFFSETCMFVCY